MGERATQGKCGGRRGGTGGCMFHGRAQTLAVAAIADGEVRAPAGRSVMVYRRRGPVPGASNPAARSAKHPLPDSAPSRRRTTCGIPTHAKYSSIIFE
ncbi:hypothetical protein [Azospirillum palustre]